MKLAKAIEIGKLYLKDPCPVMTPDQLTSYKLLIEAGKACKVRSDRFPNLPHLRLPGETDE